MPQDWKAEARKMAESQLIARGIKDEKVLKAMMNTPRHLFVPEDWRAYAYYDTPLPIGYGQTISQPYIVAFMTELLGLKGDEKVLEIGTGSGYQAAILSQLADSVFTIELIGPLANRARQTLKSLGYENVYVKTGDGYKGWIEHAPYDAIIVTAAPEEIPQALKEQLKTGGVMVIPVGENHQRLMRVYKRGEDEFEVEDHLPVMFVPMVKPNK